MSRKSLLKQASFEIVADRYKSQTQLSTQNSGDLISSQMDILRMHLDLPFNSQALNENNNNNDEKEQDNIIQRQCIWSYEIFRYKNTPHDSGI